MYCSLGPTHAGGAGAGNPATLAMIADGVDTTISRDTIPVTLPICDSSCMRIEVNGVFVLVQYASFPVPDDFDSIPEPLYYDSSAGEMILDGPFLFDVLRGTSAPDIHFHLPNGIYEYIKLHIAHDSGTSVNDFNELMKGYQILISGKFTYEDTLRNINIFILSDTTVQFHALDNGVAVFNTNFVKLIVGLNEQEWLDSISIKGPIKKGDVFFDSEGNLTLLDDPSGQGPDAKLCMRMRSRIYGSGVFRHSHTIR